VGITIAIVLLILTFVLAATTRTHDRLDPEIPESDSHHHEPH